MNRSECLPRSKLSEHLHGTGTAGHTGEVVSPSKTHVKRWSEVYYARAPIWLAADPCLWILAGNLEWTNIKGLVIAISLAEERE